MNLICAIRAIISYIYNTNYIFLAYFPKRFNIWNQSRPFICNHHQAINPLSTNPGKWSNTVEQFFGNLPTNCLTVFDHFVGLVLKGLSNKLFEIDGQKGFYTLLFSQNPLK